MPEGSRMTGTAKLADIHQIQARPDRLSSLFHMVNRIIPEAQDVVFVSPETSARDALALMRKHGYSQLPVKQGDSILGLFTFRAFAIEVAEIGDKSVDASMLPVEEFLEHDTPVYAQLTDEFRNLIDVLNESDSVVVSGPENLIAILTPMDLLIYLYSVANAFVLIEEIELALRALIRAATDDDELFQLCIENALSAKYKDSELPRKSPTQKFN